MRDRVDLGLVSRYGVMTAIAALFVGPLLFMISSSFKPDAQIFEDLRSVRAFLPLGDVSLDNYVAVFERSALPRYLFNSLLISTVTVTLGILVNSLCAFGLQRMTWRGQDLVLAFVLALLVIPFELTALPLMLIVSGLPWVGFEDGAFVWHTSWFNTLHVQIVPFVANAFTIFLFYQFFKDIPEDLDDAARMDGANALQIYWHVVLPNSGPAIGTSAIIMFLGTWNQYLWPILVVQSQDVRPVMVGMQQFFGPANAWGEIMAYATLVTLPVLAVFVLFQRQFVQSVVGSGLKG